MISIGTYAIPTWSLVFFLTGVVFSLLAIRSVWFEKRISPWWFFLLAGFFGLSFSTLSSYLFIWDEQFHALVAKNLSENPFHPKLMNFSPWMFADKNWASQYTWLHKPPLFLYAMAVSIKIFGTKIIAVRLPSILLFAFTTKLLYQLAAKWRDEKTGLVAAFLFVFCGFTLLQLSGQKTTDHNDVFFTCLVFISFYYWFKLKENPTKLNHIVLGLWVAACVLTKWLPGLLVLLPYTLHVVYALYNQKLVFRRAIKRFLWILYPLILGVLPWHLYTLFFFPDRAMEELGYNQEHFFYPLEGHREPWYFHFQTLWTVFSWLWLLPLFYLLRHFFLRKRINPFFFYVLVAALFMLLFYALAATRMEGFMGPLIPLSCLLIAYAIPKMDFTLWGKVFLVAALPLSLLFMQPQKMLHLFGYEQNTEKWNNRVLYEGQRTFIEKHGDSNPKKLVLNATMRMHGNIQWMFFTKNKAIAFLPNEVEIKKLQQEGFQLSCLKYNDPLPDYITEDPKIKIWTFE